MPVMHSRRGAAEPTPHEATMAIRTQASAAEALAHKDLGTLEPEELAALDRLAGALAFGIPPRRGSRREADPTGRHTDLRRTLRLSLRTGGQPITLARSLDDDAHAELRLLVGHRSHLVKDQTAVIARLRELLAGIHPGLERVVDPTNPSGLLLLTRYVTPAEIRTAGAARITAWMHRRGVKNPTARHLATAAHTAAAAQRVALPGEDRTADLIKQMAVE